MDLYEDLALENLSELMVYVFDSNRPYSKANRENMQQVRAGVGGVNFHFPLLFFLLTFSRFSFLTMEPE